jgi:hypothetical protein
MKKLKRKQFKKDKKKLTRVYPIQHAKSLT